MLELLEPLYLGSKAIDLALPICVGATPLKWNPGETAPRDGTVFLALVDKLGIQPMRWRSADEFAAKFDCDPEEGLAAFVLAEDDWAVHEPRFWCASNDGAI